MKHLKENLTAIVSLLIIPLSGMATDIYVPSLPALSEYFSTTQYLSQFTVTAYLLGYSISQLFSGIIVDVAGTRRTSIISLLIFTILNYFILISTNIYMVCLFRVLQGISVGFFAVAQRSIMPNIFKHDPEKMRNMINYAMITWSLGPIVAPAIGGYLQHLFGWKYNFIFLATYSLCMLIFVIFITIEAIENKIDFNFEIIKSSYHTILSNKIFILSVLCLSCIYSVSILFATIGSFIIQNQMHYNSIFFGYCSLSMGVTWFIGSISNKYITKINHYKKIIFCLKIMLIIYSISIITNIFINGFYSFVIFIILSNIFAGVIFSSYYAKNLSMFPKYSGNAAGLMSSGLIMITAIISSIFSKLITKHQIIMLLTANFILILICYILTRIIINKHNNTNMVTY